MQTFWHLQEASNKHLDLELVPRELFHTEISLIADISILFLESALSRILQCVHMSSQA